MKSRRHFKINNNAGISDCKYDEDEDVCRICRNPGDSENQLKCPCACSGSIKFVHQDCLLQWLDYSNARQCEDAARQDDDPVPFDDLLIIGVLSSNMKIVGAAIFLPFSIGRIIIHTVCWFSTTTAIPMFCSRLSDATILAAGYMFIGSMVLFYFGIVAMVSYVEGEALNVGRLYGIIYIADAITSFVKQYTTTMRRLMSMVRPAFLLLVELGVFPLICGWWLDVCTFRILGKTVSLMVEFSSFSPLASSLMQWCYMLQFGIYTFGICDIGSLKLLRIKCILPSVK
ncbi:hypothetical protein MKW92_037622 [Papaver armeniacum]|nr:hypothetical protein MKW92_037622 [Papaver armeniacum]